VGQHSRQRLKRLRGRRRGRDGTATLTAIPRLDPRSVLTYPRMYTLAQRGFGALRSRQRFVSQFLRPEPGDRILDIGCGTGEILPFLPAVEYVGFDLSSQYIASARARYGDRGRFYRADVLEADLGGELPFDLVIAMGVIHHLDNMGADRLIAISAAILNPTGRLVTFDGTFLAGQPRVARWLLERDRGEYVRSPEAYVALAASHFADVRHHVVSDFLHIPYTQCVLDAWAPQPSPSPERNRRTSRLS
jgi:SAM-dependent methyltransferase